ncbi:hydroxymethylglutaryl-CoA reductase, degradative [Vagococcus luciliae]|uniref:3-hydroxy-3-methylglutaryl coenzyme A reductase n=1 Tax=Vagococcus luciliae TaxID=2920380 RepID=A0ABY5NZB0_9ENTE|nr:hydroxymethylglutaryl-CoA reductase, degradative [Vagococcus luciliae]UUV98990.1 3-hydroxy-3-methylglutaryl-coenzyme A reductase [Vagococcus luciliae]
MDKSFDKFYKKTRDERLATLLNAQLLSQEDYSLFKKNMPLDEDVANSLIENQLTQFPIPLGVALNFIIDGKEKTVPMVVEEPSVIAACSYAAKMTRPNGFETSITSYLKRGQIIFTGVENLETAQKMLLSHLEEIKKVANLSHPSIVKRGGGLQNIECSIFKDENDETFFTVYLLINVGNAMGANIINTILEGVTPFISELIDGEALMSILSNYNTESLVTATCSIPFSHLDSKTTNGKEIAHRIVQATRYANLDTYRAVTHNKGIMNGIDSVVIATGNDPRAVSAAAHAYACRNGRYQSMADWHVNDDSLIGELTLPVSIGTVGGAISVLPMAKANLDMLGITDSQELARVIVSVGLAQNLAALKALVSDGIQKGHMKLHASSLAIQVGAVGDEIEQVTEKLRQASHMNTQTATDILKQLREI